MEKSASGPAKSPRGPSLSMEQLLALARSSSSSEEPSSNAASSSSLLQLSSESALPVALSPRPPDEQQEQDAQEQDALERVAAALRDETHRALARQLASAVRELAVWTRARQQQHEGEEEEAEEASRRVRGPLCSALAQILAYRFKVGTSWLGSWGGPQHFWQFIMDFSANSSVNTVAGLSLQKCLKQLAADPKAGHDDNSRFRSFVVVALNQGKVRNWHVWILPDVSSFLFFFFLASWRGGWAR